MHILKIHQKASYSNPQVHSSLKYADVLWDGFSESDTIFLKKLTNRGHKGCNRCFKRVSLLNLSLNINEISWIELIKKISQTWFDEQNGI